MALHGHGRRSQGTNTPESDASSGLQDMISAPQSISSAKRQEVPLTKHLEARENFTESSSNETSGKSNSNISMPVVEGIHLDTPSRGERSITCGPNVQAWLSFDESTSDLSTAASEIFSNTLVGNLKEQNLNFVDIINNVGSSWQKLSPEERQAFEQQASNTSKAMQETADAAAAELDTGNVSDTAKKEIVDRLMGYFYRLFGNKLQESSDCLTGIGSSWGSSQSVCTSIDLEPSEGNDGSRRGQTTQGRDRSHQLFPQSGSAAQSRKRNGRSSQEGDSDFEEDESDGKRRKPSSGKPDGLSHIPRRFACPFTKRFRDQPPKTSACICKGFSTAHRVKEHLYRVHLQHRYTCFRCYEKFDNDTQLKAHARAAEICEAVDEPPDEQELDAEQEKQLKSEKLARDASEENKWAFIYLSSANVGSKNSGKAEQHHNETGRSSLEHAKPDDDLKPSVPTEKVQKVELDGTLVYVTARTEIVNRLMDTFYELFATERCPEGEEPPQDEELSQEQERSLRSKRRLGREGSEEVRWRQIFQICFPEVLEVDISSPYCEWQQSPGSGGFEHFEQFQRRMLPELVRQALDEAVPTAPQLAQLEESVRSQLVDIIRTCQDQVCEQYRMSTNSPRDRAGPNDLATDVCNNTLQDYRDEVPAFEHSTSFSTNADPPRNLVPGALCPIPQDEETAAFLDLNIFTSNHPPSQSHDSDSGYGTTGAELEKTREFLWLSENSYAMLQEEGTSDWQTSFGLLPHDLGEEPSGLNGFQSTVQNEFHLDDLGVGEHFDSADLDGGHSSVAPFPNHRKD
ncbi:hypothetical protein GTA08_BOTSDO07540 [Botryosphaeria dothidea]|uniref:C2H2-type domain-containing protein n=1 Tax=Botryosphaeria dothidea TaxID=55169 RepID=A0A8H4N2W7_9PEZI|nr:hypothetical protein GTA08_BOTSDO07540 [Botryosphaeria dothidea]